MQVQEPQPVVSQRGMYMIKLMAYICLIFRSTNWSQFYNLKKEIDLKKEFYVGNFYYVENFYFLFFIFGIFLLTGRRLTAVAQKGKDLPPQSRGLDGVETLDENIPSSRPLAQDKGKTG